MPKADTKADDASSSADAARPPTPPTRSTSGRWSMRSGGAIRAKELPANPFMLAPSTSSTSRLFALSRLWARIASAYDFSRTRAAATMSRPKRPRAARRQEEKAELGRPAATKIQTHGRRRRRGCRGAGVPRRGRGRAVLRARGADARTSNALLVGGEQHIKLIDVHEGCVHGVLQGHAARTTSASTRAARPVIPGSADFGAAGTSAPATASLLRRRRRPPRRHLIDVRLDGAQLPVRRDGSIKLWDLQGERPPPRRRRRRRAARAPCAQPAPWLDGPPPCVEQRPIASVESSICSGCRRHLLRRLRPIRGRVGASRGTDERAGLGAAGRRAVAKEERGRRRGGERRKRSGSRRMPPPRRQRRPPAAAESAAASPAGAAADARPLVAFEMKGSGSGSSASPNTARTPSRSADRRPGERVAHRQQDAPARLALHHRLPGARDPRRGGDGAPHRAFARRPPGVLRRRVDPRFHPRARLTPFRTRIPINAWIRGGFIYHAARRRCADDPVLPPDPSLLAE